MDITDTKLSAFSLWAIQQKSRTSTNGNFFCPGGRCKTFPLVLTSLQRTPLLYTWVARGTVRLECFAQEHKTKSLARARTRTNLIVIRKRKMKQTKRSMYGTTTLIPRNGYLSTKSTLLCLQSGRCGEVQTEVSKLICKYVNLLFSQVKVIIKRTIVITTL